ncbi:MAG: acyl carrier protein [PVC group bacterium]|nr:acyl carrier protein [PVC group bacterium]
MAETINFEEVKTEVRKIVAEIIETSEEELKDDAEFVEDLGVDSMMALEIVAVIEKKFKITIPEEEIPNIGSLQKIYDILKKRMAS